MRPAFSFLRGTVARRILALFLLCALLPVGSLAAFSLWEMSGTLTGQTEQRLHRIAKNINVALLQGLGFLQTEMEVLARSSDVHPEKRSGHFLGLTLFREGSEPHTIFGTLSPSPSLTGTMGAHLGKGLAAIFTEGVPGALSRVHMAVPVRRGNLGHGVLVGEIDPKYLGEIIDSAMPLEGDLTVLDSTGAPVYNLKSLPPDIVRHVADRLRRTHAGWFEWNREGDAVLATYRSIFLGSFFHENNWTVVFLTSKAAMFAPIRSFTRMFLLIVVLTLLVVSFLSIGQIRRSLDPLAKLQEGTQNISRGDFESRVEVKSGDEFEELANSFNIMSERLRREFHGLTETSRIVRSFLSGLEKEKIVQTVLSNMQSIFPCEEVALFLIDSGGNGTARIYTDGSGSGNPADPRQTPVVFTPEELQKLGTMDGNPIVESGDEFLRLLAPISRNGVLRFVLLPLLHKERLVGVLAMGSGPGSKQVRENLLRVRQIGDQVVVALANADLLEELAALSIGAITALARAVDAKSPWTAGHSERVTALSVEIGRAMGLAEEELAVLHRGGLLHDLGKIGIPGAILDKQGKLTDQEFTVIKGHPEKGVRILEPIPAFREILPVVAQHHEWVNGRGYPHGLAGDDICRGARILAVADVYEALTADRPYRAGWHPHRALSLLEENSGVQFDPEVVKAFKNIILAADAVERFPQEVHITCPGV